LLIWAKEPCVGVAPVWVGGVKVEWVLLGPVPGLLYGGGVRTCHAVGRRLMQCLRVSGLRDLRWEARCCRAARSCHPIGTGGFR